MDDFYPIGGPAMLDVHYTRDLDGWPIIDVICVKPRLRRLKDRRGGEGRDVYARRWCRRHKGGDFIRILADLCEMDGFRDRAKDKPVEAYLLHREEVERLQRRFDLLGED